MSDYDCSLVTRSLSSYSLLVGLALLGPSCSSSSTNEGSGGGGSDGGGSGGTSGSSAKINCGTLTCDPTSESCCYSTTDIEITDMACAAACTAPLTHSAGCDSAGDCEAQGATGSICCATVKTPCGDGNPEQCMQSAQCALPANCAAEGQVILCDPTEPGACPSGKPCVGTSGLIRRGTCSP